MSKPVCSRRRPYALRDDSLRCRLQGAAVLAAVGVIATACAGASHAPRSSLRNCVDLQTSAVSRQRCFEELNEDRKASKACVLHPKGVGGSSGVPVDNARLDGLVEEAKYVSHADWLKLANVPLVFKVDWAGTMVGDESQSTTGWLRGALLGTTATLTLQASPENAQVVNMAVRPDGAVMTAFLQAAPSTTLDQASKALHVTEQQLEGMHDNLHGLFTGLYRALDKAGASSPCYVRFAGAQLRMDQEIGRLEEAVKQARTVIVAQFTKTSQREAAVRREDARAWAESQVEQCRKAEKATDCDGVDAYLAKFPTGARAAEAKAALEAVHDKISRLRDEAAWAGAGVPRCKSPETSTACDGVRQYLEKYPKGAHAVEAGDLLRLKRFPLAQLAANEDQKRRLAAIRKQRACIDDCVTGLRRCQSKCRAGDPSELVVCQRTCLRACNGTCLPACKP